ncbi:hypothetical protein ACOSQ4_025818 [Xanthoceras sorbifolium]
MRDHALTMDLSSLSEPPHNSNDANLLNWRSLPVRRTLRRRQLPGLNKDGGRRMKRETLLMHLQKELNCYLGHQYLQASVMVMPNQRPPQAVWCELCRVDCTGLEILEQHKNGKRHKKNSQKIEELRKVVTPMAEIHMNRNLAESNSKVSQQPEFTQDCQMNETAGYVPKVVIPLIGDLCNVKRDTQEVLTAIFLVKKHVSKPKRFEGHRVMYGPTGVQETLYHPQGHHQPIVLRFPGLISYASSSNQN